MAGLFVAAVGGALHPRALTWWICGLLVAVGVVAVRLGVSRPPARVVVGIALWWVVAAIAAVQLEAAERAPMGPWSGVAVLRSDPDRRGSAVQAVLELDGYRYEAWAYGSRARALDRRLAGEQVVLVGHRRPLEGVRRTYLTTRHVVGRVEIQYLAGAEAGRAAARASNRVHRIITEVGSSWTPDRRALLSGLILGNDKALSETATGAFRRSGLSHLTAVSGQNVALLLGLMSPIIMRTGRWLRLTMIVAVVMWFTVLTRFEPSVLRASAMAILGASAAVLGRDRRPRRLVALAGALLILIDPVLARSVSFWLSMSATAGLVLFTPALDRILGRLHRPLRVAFSTTAGAQLGVLAVSTAVFGLPSSVSLVTNLVAVGPAGLVMASGPLLTAVGALSGDMARLVAAPLELLVWWIEWVAVTGQRLAPPKWVDITIWSCVIATTGRGLWHRARGR